MKALRADFIVDSNNIYKDSVIVFDEKIIGIYPKDKYQGKIKDLGKNSIIMPGLINSHIHLEFSKNKTSLNYGNFTNWLSSVIANREKLIEFDDFFLDEVLNDILYSGTTTIGAISSYGIDLNPCINSSINVVYFNEVLGSKPDMVDMLFNDFLNRLENSLKYKSKNFIPSIAIHSPYSTHPILIKKVLSIAKEKNLLVSTHFLESTAEKEWLENSSGEFKEFFKFLDIKQSVNTIDGFLDLFEDAIFVHCLEVDDFDKLKQKNIKVVSCPRSNRLLNNKILDLDKSFAIATDGLSSNISLSMFDELRYALFMYQENLEETAKKLFTNATKNPAILLKLNKGLLTKGYDADLICFNLETNEEKIYSDIILHTQKVKMVFINGKKI